MADLESKPSFWDKVKTFFASLGGKIKKLASTVGEKIDIKKNKWKIIGYGGATIATVVTFSCLLGWASSGDGEEIIEVLTVSALAKENARVEYVVGETAKPDGFALVIDGKVQSDCMIDVDTSTAGVKSARVYFEDGNTTYEGYYPVTVFGVRHLDVRVQPTGIEEKEDGSVGLKDIVVWAELSGEPKQLPLQSEHPDWKSTIVLSPENYTVWVTEDANGKTVTLRSGGCSASFVFVTIGGENYVLNSTARILSFNNGGSFGNEKLTLYVFETESNNSDGDVGASGKYVFTDAFGLEHVYDFAYYITGWESHFVSNEKFNNGVYERQVGDDLQVTINGVVFTASHSAWTGAILTL
ncbi:MAG: hypothetical protein J1F39_03250 [Clostridiales bacterium]|nr:hypothetical protein [Clostridiales bacterium]